MKKPAGTIHVVVDGSNIATEGRSTPSLVQLNDAVLAYVAQHPHSLVTVVVDATFGHRIDKSERAEFDAAIANNELVAPPAGAIGRGDAFILGVADKAGAVVLSNDSFQEFHGQYSWLFDPGRLIGGKPVPHVGWVFVERMPVRGPISRRSRAVATDKATPAGSAPRVAPSTRRVPTPATPPPRPAGETAVRAVNDIVAFLDFAEHHSAGSRLRATVHSYASHGAYVTSDGVKCYVPLRLMGTPPPSRARELMSIGDTVEIEIVEFAPVRRSIDCALVRVVDRRDATSGDPGAGGRATKEKKAAESRSTKAEAKSTKKDPTPKKTAVTKKSASKKVAGTKTAAAKRATGATAPATKKDSTPTRRSTPTSGASRKPAPKAVAPKAVASKAVASKTVARKTGAHQKSAAKKTGSPKAGAASAARRRPSRSAPSRPAKASPS